MKPKNRKKPYLLVAVNLIIFTCFFTTISLIGLQLTWSELRFIFALCLILFALLLGFAFNDNQYS